MIPRTRKFSANVNYLWQNLGDTGSTQAILTGTYRLTSERAVSCRVVQQTGGGVDGTNVYLAFSQRARSGADVFLLLGDPNSQKTHGIVTLKVIRPF